MQTQRIKKWYPLLLKKMREKKCFLVRICRHKWRLIDRDNKRIETITESKIEDFVEMENIYLQDQLKGIKQNFMTQTTRG